MRWLPVLLPFVALTAGCNNACQQLCVTMADYAEECGYEVADSEVSQCIADHGFNEYSDSMETCAEFNDPDTVREEWSCADVGVHFSESSNDTEDTNSGGDDTTDSESDAPSDTESGSDTDSGS